MGEVAAELIPLVDRPHVLYRMFDRSKHLLYVGITVDARARWKAHGEDKSWWTDVASIEVQHFTSRAAAERAEQLAIRSERPLHNIVHQLRYTVPRFIAKLPKSRMKHRNFRIDDKSWFAISRLAELDDRPVSDLIRELLHRYVDRNKKLLDNDPEWQARVANARETGEW